MAHECPECGMICHCGVDIDDCVMNDDDDVVACVHCVCKECGYLASDCDCFEDRDDDDFHTDIHNDRTGFDGK
jgi:C4-type Zn-finger protein